MIVSVLTSLTILLLLEQGGARRSSAKCDERYFQHYYLKGCKPMYKYGFDCPVQFDCPKNKSETKSVCNFNGYSFKRGESIDVGDPCKRCFCNQNDRSAAYIDCILTECPEYLTPSLKTGCYHIYEPDKCCPSKFQCPTKEIQETGKVCQHDGKTYHYGEQIYPKEDPCQICLCDDQWTGVGGKSCRYQNCELELNKQRLSKGCVPIYHEAACCPIESFCGSIQEGYLKNTASLAQKGDIYYGNTCVFQGKHYKIGQTLNMNHPTNCVSCSCSTPPEFTCIHKACPAPPNGSYDNCKPTYTPGECCPTYYCKNLYAIN